MSHIVIDNARKIHIPTALHTSPLYMSAHPDGQDERGSLSGSEDGSYVQYAEMLKVETDNEGEFQAVMLLSSHW